MIEVRGLVKYFGFRNETLALNNISFSVDQGVRFGLLGAKGAGKTTVLRVLAGTLRPTAGAVSIGGTDALARAQEVRKLIGYSPESLDVRDWNTGKAYLDFWARATGLSRKERIARLSSVVEFLELKKWLDEELAFSTVETQRQLTLAQALLSDPEVLLMDEPMTGLSPAGMEFLAKKLVALQKEGKTVVLSSHRLRDIRAACDHVAVMSEGRLTKVFGTEDLLRKIGEGRDSRIFVDSDTLPAQAIDALKKLEAVVDVRSTGTATIVYIVPGRVEPQAVREILEAQNVKVRGLRQAELKLGDVFSTLHT